MRGSCGLGAVEVGIGMDNNTSSPASRSSLRMLRAVVELEYTECQFLQLLEHALLVPNPKPA